MPVYVQWPASSALERRLKEIAAAVGPNSAKSARVKGDIRRIVIEDNTDKILARSVDRYGKPLKELAESTRKNPRRGTGPVLAPHSAQSRFIRCFQAVWQGGTLVMRWAGMVNDRGQPFAQYHLTGATKPGTKWVLPKRDVGGITPQGWAKIVARHKQFAADVLGRGA